MGWALEPGAPAEPLPSPVPLPLSPQFSPAGEEGGAPVDPRRARRPGDSNRLALCPARTQAVSRMGRALPALGRFKSSPSPRPAPTPPARQSPLLPDALHPRPQSHPLRGEHRPASRPPSDGGARLAQGGRAEPASNLTSPRRPLSSPRTQPGGAALEGSGARSVLPARAEAPGPAAALHFGAQLGWRRWQAPPRGVRARTNVASRTGGPG